MSQIIIVPDPKKLGEDLADTVDNHGGCMGCSVKFVIIAAIVALFMGSLEKSCSHNKEIEKQMDKEKWRLNEIVKNSEEIFKINSKDRKIYNFNNVDDISKINNLVGLQNGRLTGFYPIEERGKIIIGISLEQLDKEYKSYDKDMTTATFKNDGFFIKGTGSTTSSYLTFEEVVRFKLYEIDPNSEKIKQIIQNENNKLEDGRNSRNMEKEEKIKAVNRKEDFPDELGFYVIANSDGEISSVGIMLNGRAYITSDLNITKATTTFIPYSSRNGGYRMSGQSISFDDAIRMKRAEIRLLH